MIYVLRGSYLGSNSIDQQTLSITEHDYQEDDPMLSDPIVLILMYFVLPLWLAAGFADWLCHRASKIQNTSGVRESLIHLLMFIQVAIPILAALFLEINALIIAATIVAFLIHEATALWDISFATSARTVSPLEQLVHSFLEMIPLMATCCIISLHWGQFLALFGFGMETACFVFAWKPQSLPNSYITAILTVVLLFEFIPYAEEFVRCLRANSMQVIPPTVGRPRFGQKALHQSLSVLHRIGPISRNT
jgi:hypothetical protein